MIIAAACLSKFTKSGDMPMCPFGRGHDHGEAHRELLQVYDVFDSICDGFFASVDGKVVFLNREDAMKHALEHGQVPDSKKGCKRLNSEMLISWEKDEMYDRLVDMDYRMRDFYWALKSKWRIDNDYTGLPRLTDDEKKQIAANVAESCKFEGITL